LWVPLFGSPGAPITYRAIKGTHKGCPYELRSPYVDHRAHQEYPPLVAAIRMIGILRVTDTLPRRYRETIGRHPPLPVS
jgi:hypothetical protein